MADNSKEQLFKYLLILDFEATCDKKNPPLPQVGRAAPDSSPGAIDGHDSLSKSPG
jgi:hypothetical protein